MGELKYYIHDIQNLAKGTIVGMRKFLETGSVGTTSNERLEIFAQMVAITGLAEIPVTVLSGAILSLPLGILGLLAGLFYDPHFRDC